APVLPELDVQNVDLEDVSHFGAAHFDRTRDWMEAGAARQLLHDLYVIGQQPGRIGRQLVGACRGDGLNAHDIAGFDRQHRLEGRVEIAPDRGIDRAGQIMCVHSSPSPARRIISFNNEIAFYFYVNMIISYCIIMRFIMKAPSQTAKTVILPAVPAPTAAARRRKQELWTFDRLCDKADCRAVHGRGTKKGISGISHVNQTTRQIGQYL